MYSLESLWLLKADKDRLDAFHCMCLRRILHVAPSFVSRVSNNDVYTRAHQSRYSDVLGSRQKRLFEKIQTMPVESVIRSLVCTLDGQPKSWFRRRSRGRPQQRWATSVYNLVVA